MASPLTIQGTGVTDAFFRSNEPDTNKSTTSAYYIGKNVGGTVTTRFVVKFDLSDIPAGATISSAVLTLTVASQAGASNTTMSVYRILQTVVITEVTWNSYSTGNSWSTAGCANTTTDRESNDISNTPSTGENPAAGTQIVFTLLELKWHIQLHHSFLQS